MGRSQIYHSGDDMEFLGDFGELVNIDSVSSEVDNIRAPVFMVAEFLGTQNEPGTLASWKVLTRGGGDFVSSASESDRDSLSWFHPANCGTRAKVLAFIDRGEHVAAVQQLTTEIVEVIWVVLVT